MMKSQKESYFSVHGVMLFSYMSWKFNITTVNSLYGTLYTIKYGITLVKTIS